MSPNLTSIASPVPGSGIAPLALGVLALLFPLPPEFPFKIPGEVPLPICIAGEMVAERLLPFAEEVFAEVVETFALFPVIDSFEVFVEDCIGLVEETADEIELVAAATWDANKAAAELALECKLARAAAELGFISICGFRPIRSGFA